MIVNKYEPFRMYDRFFEHAILTIKKTIMKKDDDFLLLCVGRTGSGKSSLMLHTLELYCGNEASLDFICITRETFADKQYEIGTRDGVRFLGNDEADAGKRNALSKWNKDLLQLYFKNRGQNIFHWWNNPSLEMIDKEFIQERIKGMIYIATKDSNRPRIYYYLRMDDLLNLYEYAAKNNQKLTLPFLKKNVKRFAYAVGWFKEYKGRFAKEYFDRLKPEGMMAHSLEFKEKYGERKEGVKMFKRSEIAAELSMGNETIRNYEVELLKANELEMGVDIQLLPSGKKVYSEMAREKFKELAETKRLNSQNAILKHKTLEKPNFSGFGGAGIN